MTWTITIPVEPTAQMRARACVRGKFASTHKHKTQATRENALMAHIAQHMPAVMFSGPLMLRVAAFMPLPKSKPKTWLAQAQAGNIRPTTKPDLDNLVKQAKDVLTQMGVWEDDKLVVGYLPGTGKFYSDRPRWEIEVREWVAEVAA